VEIINEKTRIMITRWLSVRLTAITTISHCSFTHTA